MRFRARVLQGIRDYFTSLEFWEAETPLVVPSPGVETHLVAIGCAEGLGGRKMYLSPSPEFQMKRLLAAGSGSIFQIARAFRGDEEGIHHNPEFTMLEWYSVGSDSEALRLEVEGLYTYLVEKLDITAPCEMPPWPRLTIPETFARHAGVTDIFAPAKTMLRQAGLEVPQDITWDEAFFMIFVEKVEPNLTGPLFLMDWPAQMASLSRLKDDDPRFADRFEWFAGGLELGNGFGELRDATEQRQRSEEDLRWRVEHGRPAYPMDEKFLDALSEGMPPVSGIAVGVDRLVMLLARVGDIRRVLSFSFTEL